MSPKLTNKPWNSTLILLPLLTQGYIFTKEEWVILELDYISPPWKDRSTNRTRQRLMFSLLLLVSSEGALIAITPYDYPAAATFWAFTGPRQQLAAHNAMMTLVTLITIMTEINKITRNVKWHKMWNDRECQMTRNIKWHEMSNDTKCEMTQIVKWHNMKNGKKW